MPRKLNTGAACAFAIGIEWFWMTSRGGISLTFACVSLLASATMLWLGLESLKKYGVYLPPKKR